MGGGVCGRCVRGREDSEELADSCPLFVTFGTFVRQPIGVCHWPPAAALAPLLPSPPTTPPLAAATVVVPLRVLVNEKTRSRLLFMASIIPAQWPTTLAT